MKNFQLCDLRLLCFVFCLTAGCNSASTETKLSACDYLREVAAKNDDGSINIVVEIPAGTNQKWETDKKSGHLKWSRNSDGELRTVQFLAYPANYGMIPRTWLPADEGGDNDPLDVFLLGETVQRGTVVAAKVIGVIRMKDGGEQDDKLIAVPREGIFHKVTNMDELRTAFPGAEEILVTWLENYKANKQVEIVSVDDRALAEAILEKSIAAFPRFTAE